MDVGSSNRVRWLCALCVWTMTTSSVVGASAQEGAAAGAPVDEEAARIHFASGRAYFVEGDYQNALDAFRRSYELSHRPPLLYNIANCLERLARYGEAADQLAAWIETGTVEAGDRATLERRITNLRELESAREASDAAREAELRALEQELAQRTSPGGEHDVGAEDDTGLLVGASVAFGVGGVGLALMGIFGGLALAEESSARERCGEGASATCTPDQVRAIDDLALGADVSMGIGLAAVATGAVLAIVAATNGPSTPPATAAVAVLPEGGAMLVVGGVL